MKDGRWTPEHELTSISLTESHLFFTEFCCSRIEPFVELCTVLQEIALKDDFINFLQENALNDFINLLKLPLRQS